MLPRGVREAMQHILVVEDEPLLHEAISTTFGLRGGFDVAHAGDGEIALSLLAAARPDLALVDVMLPKVSGLRVAEYAASRNVPVILMSGHPDTIAVSAQYSFPILTKPFRISGLADMADQLLAEARLLRCAMRQHVHSRQQLIEARGSVDAEDPSMRWLRICGRVLGELSYTG